MVSIVGAVRATFLLLAGFFLLAMLTVVLFQAAGRYLFHYSLDWITELSLLFQVGLGVCGFGVACRFGSLFAVEAAFNLLGEAGARVLRIIIAALGLLFCAVLSYGVIALAIAVPTQTTPVLGVPKWLVYYSIPIGFAYLALEIVLGVFNPRYSAAEMDENPDVT